MKDKESWRAAKLGDFLNEAQMKEVLRICRSTSDPTERTLRLRDYFGTFRADLEAKGMLPEFLAYLVSWLVSEHWAPETHPHINN